MAAESEPRPRKAVPRTAAHECGDLEDAVRNAVDGAYLDWPNEAGVSATPAMFVDRS